MLRAHTRTYLRCDPQFQYCRELAHHCFFDSPNPFGFFLPKKNIVGAILRFWRFKNSRWSPREMRLGRLSLVTNLSHPRCKAIGGRPFRKKNQLWTMLGMVENMDEHMDVSENSGTPKSSILIGVSIINYPFWGTPIFRNTHMLKGSWL